jgi:hypothetical protein
VPGRLLALVALATVKVISNGKEGHPVGGVERSAPSNVGPSGSLEKATFGAGWFCCTEVIFQRLKGVKSVVSGYSGGQVLEPSNQHPARRMK